MVKYKLIFLYAILHVICFIIEVYRYKHGSLNLKFFISDGLMDMTYMILGWDLIAAIILVGAWIFAP